jgi:uncharacterized membrane protein
MSELVVVGFKDAEEADRVLFRLIKLKKAHLMDLEDAVVVIRDEAGKVHLKQSINLTAAEGFAFLSGSLWGALVGLLFLHPIAGLVVGGALGAGARALSGSLSDYGIDDDFIKSLGKTIPVNSSALFILVCKAEPEKILAEFSSVKGNVLRTSLSPEQEKKLREALADSTAATA